MLSFIQPNARLVAQIAADRVTMGKGDGAGMPVVGDLVFADQAWAGPDGRNMYLVYCQRPDGSVRWEAELLESELEPLAPARA
jgi:hypothetical protein